MSICLGGTVPACKLVGSLARHRGAYTSRQRNAANEICSAGRRPLCERWCHTPPSTWLHLLIHVPKQRSKAEQDRTGLFTGTCASPWERLEGKRGLWNPMCGTQKDYPSCTLFTEPNFLGILLQNRCKILPSAHCSHDCARCKKATKMPAWASSLYPAQRETHSWTIQRKSCRRAVVMAGLICSTDNHFQFWNIQTLPGTLAE